MMFRNVVYATVLISLHTKGRCMYLRLKANISFKAKLIFDWGMLIAIYSLNKHHLIYYSLLCMHNLP